jgi:hypothetical protein
LGYVKQSFKDVIETIATGKSICQIKINAINIDHGSGKMVPGDAITSKISLENVVEDGIRELVKEKEKYVKVLVEI